MAFFDLNAGLKLALWPRKSLAHDTGLPVSSPSATDFSVGHNVASKEEVDAVMAQAEKAGAEIVKPAQVTFWGVMPAISSTPIDACGKLSGIQNYYLPTNISQFHSLGNTHA